MQFILTKSINDQTDNNFAKKLTLQYEQKTFNKFRLTDTW